MAIIVLTAGHGGKDPGAVAGSTTEAAPPSPATTAAGTSAGATRTTVAL